LADCPEFYQKNCIIHHDDVDDIIHDDDVDDSGGGDVDCTVDW